MSRWQPCKRREFIKPLRQLDFDGRYSGTRHQFMVYKKIPFDHTILSTIIWAHTNLRDHTKTRQRRPVP